MKYIHIILLLGLVSCEPLGVVRFSSIDRTQSITMWKSGQTIYLIIGEDLSLQREYVKLDVSGVSFDAQALFVCWDKGKYELEMLFPKSKIIENRLDSSRFRFSSTDLYKLNMAAEILRFHQYNCFEFNLESGRAFPSKNVVIK